MTELRAHTRMNTALGKLADEYAKEIETAARKVLASYPSLSGFSAAMGQCCFYSKKDGYGVEYDDLPKAARAVIDFESDYMNAMGSPGIQI